MLTNIADVQQVRSNVHHIDLVGKQANSANSTGPKIVMEPF